jgi:hypothetical protein
MGGGDQFRRCVSEGGALVALEGADAHPLPPVCGRLYALLRSAGP